MQDKEKKVIKFSMDMNKVEEMIDQLMDSMMEKVPAEKQPFVMGFTINFNSEDLPIIEEINEIDEKEIEKEIVPENLSNPLAEAHYFKEEIVVSFELPKRISRKELKVDVTESSVVVMAPKHTFKRKIFLKEKINPKSFSSNFKNAFFELTFRKK